jgi:hypothetical protein
MFKKILTLALITTSLLTANSLHAAYNPNYTYIGEGVVIAVSSTCHSRTLILDNEMMFEIVPGASNWTGCKASIYRDATKNPGSHYVLNLGKYEYQAIKREPLIEAPPSIHPPCSIAQPS